nr:hypothetical protein [Tanacetum cinerariifolium]
MLVAGEPGEQGDSDEQVQGNDNNAAQCDDTAVLGDDTQDQSIPSPTLLTPPPQPPQDIPSASQEEKKAEEVKFIADDEKVKERQADIYQIDMDHAVKVLSRQEDEPEVQEAVEDIDWDVAINHVKQKDKEDPYVQRYQEEENRALESINETLAQKAVKRRKLNEEAKDVEDIKQHLEIVPDEDDDVYTEATPLARKVVVMDYHIIQLNNKPRYKIIRGDGTHQLVMFGRPDGQDQVWKSQRSVHGQANVKSWKLLESCGVHIISFTTTQLILLVERRYPLLRFTLDQMLNVVRLQVVEQSKMSLELIRFTRQQLQEGHHD